MKKQLQASYNLVGLPRVCTPPRWMLNSLVKPGKQCNMPATCTAPDPSMQVSPTPVTPTPVTPTQVTPILVTPISITSNPITLNPVTPTQSKARSASKMKSLPSQARLSLLQGRSDSMKERQHASQGRQTPLQVTQDVLQERLNSSSQARSQVAAPPKAKQSQTTKRSQSLLRTPTQERW